MYNFMNKSFKVCWYCLANLRYWQISGQYRGIEYRSYGVTKETFLGFQQSLDWGNKRAGFNDLCKMFIKYSPKTHFGRGPGGGGGIYVYVPAFWGAFSRNCENAPRKGPVALVGIWSSMIKFIVIVIIYTITKWKQLVDTNSYNYSSGNKSELEGYL